jgi:hypothetical protein
MRNTWEKITHHVGTIYGHDISNELQNKTKVTIPNQSIVKRFWIVIRIESHVFRDRICGWP